MSIRTLTHTPCHTSSSLLLKDHQKDSEHVDTYMMLVQPGNLGVESKYMYMRTKTFSTLYSYP